MSSDYILSVIREYADERLREPRRRLPQGCFEQRSYQKWAVDEIIRSIERSKSVPPITVIEDFIYKMDDFSRSSRKRSMMFSVAHDVAADILDLLLAMK